MTGARTGNQDDKRAASPRVLIVDDDDGMREVVSATLELEGMVVVEASSGDEALRALSNEQFDAVLLDRTMPGMDGIEVLNWIRRTPEIARLPVILLTAMSETAALVHGLDVGADDYITKPFATEELVARVWTHLRSNESWAQLVSLEVERRSVLTTVARAAATTSDDARMVAGQLCHELLRLPEVVGAELVETIAHSAYTLGTAGERPLIKLFADPTSPEVGNHLATRAAVGAWVEPAIRRSGGGHQAIALAPVVVDNTSVAVLLLASPVDASRVDQDRTLALAIDFAALVSGVIGPALHDSAARLTAYQRFVDLADSGAFDTVFQPVVDLCNQVVVGYEALTRFTTEPDTEQAFVRAAAVDAGHHVELRTLEAALRSCTGIDNNLWLSLNVSPSLLTSQNDLSSLLRAGSDRQLILELSELEPVADYVRLRSAVNELGSLVQLSIDDAGSGFASLAHILALRADYVKLDQSWVRDIEHDPAKRALVAGVRNFSAETGAVIVAEGIETEAELDTIRSLGVQFGQGYLLGRPAPM